MDTNSKRMSFIKLSTALSKRLKKSINSTKNWWMLPMKETGFLILLNTAPIMRISLKLPLFISILRNLKKLSTVHTWRMKERGVQSSMKQTKKINQKSRNISKILKNIWLKRMLEIEFHIQCITVIWMRRKSLRI